MIVACAIDRRFAELAGVMIYSLELNGSIPEADIWIIGDGLRRSDKEKIQACAKRKITFHDLDPSTLQHLAGFKTTSNWSRVAYARLFLPALMPPTGNLLYLDADTMIKGSLRPLLEMDLSGKVIAAMGGPSKHNLPIGRAQDAFYFNSGVVLLNLKEWQSQELTLRALELLKGRMFAFPDQDVLNLVADGQTVALDPKWNSQLAKATSDEVRIVHFTHAKPNTTYCVHPDKALFLEYRSRTPWANARLKTMWDKRLNRLLHSLRRKLKPSPKGR
ncbi:glycosyltransferase family 8 protein [Rhizobium sp. BK068]|uniref:glycosyltransferase family 8 protein n=1 Tax=Rhizobium sp. BK068 TaxID=2512130 RepID=UPI0010E1407B|nr:glycosyltransferase family 8 protein [Rhizobium sp. BK068]TCM71912.1 lipopolysaccharide biosynthesis glycosyltransferase [Rhizobium sp. BK068]